MKEKSLSGLKLYRVRDIVSGTSFPFGADSSPIPVCGRFHERMNMIPPKNRPDFVLEEYGEWDYTTGLPVFHEATYVSRGIDDTGVEVEK